MNDYDDAPTNFQAPPPPPNQAPNKDQKTAIAAAAVGTVALGGAAWGMSQFLSDDTAGNTDNPPNIVDDHSGDGDGQGDGTENGQSGTTTTSDAHLVSNGAGNGANDQDQLVSPKDRDDMTFAEAFRDARNEMGPDHYFEWHGHLYNTYYTEEWNAMSHDQQQTFLASVPHDDFPVGHTGDMLAGGEIPTPHHQTHHTTHHVVTDDVPDPVDEADIIVEDNSAVHTVVSQPQTAEVQSHDVDVAVIEVDGHAVAVFDADHDDHPDAVLFLENQVLVMDTDHDHVLDTRSTYNQETHTFGNEECIEAQHVTIDGSMDVLHNEEHASEPVVTDNHVDDLHLAGHTDFDADLGSDFDPNADISDYA